MPDHDLISRATRDTIERFNAAFNAHDVERVMALMTADCVFENTNPPPDGQRFVGAQAVRECWVQFFTESPRSVFETEELFTTGDRGVCRWRYTWAADAGRAGYIRGVDVFRVRGGQVAEKLSYVKG